MSNNTVNFSDAILYLETGKSDEKSDEAVADFIKNQLKNFTDLELYWLEPVAQLNDDNSTGRLKDFSPFGIKREQFPEKLPKLEAAYLFGKQTGLHVIATKNGCRWCQFQENEFTESEKKDVQKRSYSVLTRRDFVRFFGDNSDWFDTIKNSKLRVTEYWTDEGLLVWRLMGENSNGNRNN